MSNKIPLDRLREISKQRAVRRPQQFDTDTAVLFATAMIKPEWPVPTFTLPLARNRAESGRKESA